MAQHDLSDLVTRIDAIGGDLNELLALVDVEDTHRNYPKSPRNVIAWNVKARSAAYELVECMEAQARAAATPAPAAAPIALATEKQVTYANRLIARHVRDGDTSGFISFGGSYPTSAQLAAMSRRDISTLIDSLAGNY